jgi:hypothetical protein
VASDAAVFHALGPDTVPEDEAAGDDEVETAYDKVLLEALIAVRVNVPLNSVPTPETMTELPTLNP